MVFFSTHHNGEYCLHYLLGITHGPQRFTACSLDRGILLATATPATGASTCFGTPSHGRLQDGAQLPSNGKNFTVYSTLGAQLGRNWVHAPVAQVMLAA